MKNILNEEKQGFFASTQRMLKWVEHYKQAKDTPHMNSTNKIVEPERFKTLLANSTDPRSTIASMQISYKNLYEDFYSLINEEKLIERIEKRTHNRNLLYRIYTTLLIGFAIMVIYGIAGCLGIDMPLTRKM